MPDKCVFPFKYDGKTYFACTYEHTSDDFGNDPWCGIKSIITEEGQRKPCGPNCKGIHICDLLLT